MVLSVEGRDAIASTFGAPRAVQHRRVQRNVYVLTQNVVRDEPIPYAKRLAQKNVYRKVSHNSGEQSGRSFETRQRKEKSSPAGR